MESASPSASLNWNTKTQEDAVQHFHLTDFSLATVGGQLESVLLPFTSNDNTCYILSGNLMSPHDPGTREHYKVKVKSYYIDVGSNSEGEDANQGFWMTGDDADLRYKLVYPAAPEYAEYAMGILYLARERKLFRNYEFAYDSGTCFQMTNFILTDQALGMPQTLILPKHGKKVFVLQGRVKLNRESMQVDEQIQLSPFGDYSQLCIRTYVTNKYLVDFGREVVQQEPQIWVQDNHYNWIKLVGPCHPDYKVDYDTAMRQTINNVKGYNWKAEDEQIWRHVTNFKLTTEAGELHPLEITALNSVFILWGDLCAPPSSNCPTIPIKVYVKDFSLDLGRMSGDADQGMWMRDLQAIDNWYKLEAPAVPEYRPFADPIFHKTKKFLELYDALIFQDCSLEYTHEGENEGDRYYCTGKIKDIYRVADPKFDLDFVKNNIDFIHNYLDFDLSKSLILLDSIDRLHLEDNGHQRPSLPVTAVPPASPAHTAPSSAGTAAGTGGALVNVAPKTATTDLKEKAKTGKVETKAKVEKPAAAEVKDKKRKLDAAKEAAAAKARKVASVLNASAAATGSTTNSTVATATSTSSVAPSTPAVPIAKPIKKKQMLELDSPDALIGVIPAPIPLSVRNVNIAAAGTHQSTTPAVVKPAAVYPVAAVKENHSAPHTSSVPPTQVTPAPSGTRTLAAPTERPPETVGQKRDRSYDPSDTGNLASSKHPAYDDRSRDWERPRPAARDDSRDHRGGSRDRDSPSSIEAVTGAPNGWRDGGWNPNDRRYGEPPSRSGVDAFERDWRPATELNQNWRPRSDSTDLSAERGVGGQYPDSRPSDRSRYESPANSEGSKDLCRYCRGLRKLPKCLIYRHVDGQFMPYHYGPRPEANESNNYRSREPPGNSGHNSRASGDPNWVASGSADYRGIGNVSAPVTAQLPPTQPYTSNTPGAWSIQVPPAVRTSSPPPPDASLVRPQFSPVDPADAAADEDFGTKRKLDSIKNDMELERAKYAKKHLLHEQQQQQQSASAAQSMAASAADTLGFLQRLQSVNSKPAAPKWGTGINLKPVSPRPPPVAAGSSSAAGSTSVTTSSTSPRASSGSAESTSVPAPGLTASTGAGQPAVEVVRLGTREIDPKRRIAMTNRNSAGVYSTVQSTIVSTSGTSPRASAAVSAENACISAPVDLTLKPTKSNLRDSSEPKKGGVRWTDAEGGVLSSFLVFEKVPYMSEGDDGAAPEP